MKERINRSEWGCGRTGAFRDNKIKPAMVDCYFNVTIRRIVAWDDQTQRIGYRWEAFTNDTAQYRFEQDKAHHWCHWTVKGCEHDWEKFARMNGIKHFGYIPGYPGHFLYAFYKDWFGDRYARDCISALANEYSLLQLYLISGSFFSDAPIPGRKARVTEYKKDGRWKRLKEIQEISRRNDVEKAVKRVDYGYLNQFCPDRYPLKTKVA